MMFSATASTDEYIDFTDMGNYDHSVQRNIRKMSEYGMVAQQPHDIATIPTKQSGGTCEASCERSLQYLQRTIKSLLRQMRVHSHLFGPGEAITIDLQAELKYDDYVTLNKFSMSPNEADKYLYRVDEIMSNLIHVVEHSSSRFDFLENIIPFQAFYSFKFVVILLTSMVVCSLIVMLFVKAFYTPAVHIQLLYGFLIIFILSCVWSYSSLYEDKKAEIHAHMVQSNELPPKECDYDNLQWYEKFWSFVRTDLLKGKDACREHYTHTMTDPFWKVNPMSAISNTAGYFIFSPLDYIGGKLGSFYTNFIAEAPFYAKPFIFVIVVIITVLILMSLMGPFRIATPFLTLEPAWRPVVPALEHPVQVNPIPRRMIGLVRNEIMERPDGPVVKSVRNAATDMDGFHEYLTDEGSDDLEITSPFARFTPKDSSNVSCNQATNSANNVLELESKSSCSKSPDTVRMPPSSVKCIVTTPPPIKVVRQSLQRTENPESIVERDIEP